MDLVYNTIKNKWANIKPFHIWSFSCSVNLCNFATFWKSSRLWRQWLKSSWHDECSRRRALMSNKHRKTMRSRKQLCAKAWRSKFTGEHTTKHQDKQMNHEIPKQKTKEEKTNRERWMPLWGSAARNAYTSRLSDAYGHLSFSLTPLMIYVGRGISSDLESRFTLCWCSG